MTSPSGTGPTITTLVVAGVLACCVVWASAQMLQAAHQHGIEREVLAILKPVRAPYHGPDITHCNDAPSLWDCIRGE